MLIHNYSAQLIVSSACPVGLVLKKTIANCSNSSFDKEKNFLFHTGRLKNLKVEQMAKELSFQLVDKKYIEVVPLGCRKRTSIITMPICLPNGIG